MNKRSIEIRGITYPSAVAAAKELRVAPQTIRSAKFRDTLATVGLGHKHKKAPHTGKPVTIDKVTYASRAEASRILGIPKHKLYQ